MAYPARTDVQICSYCYSSRDLVKLKKCVNADLLVGVEGVDDQAHQLLDIRIERERLGRHGNKRCFPRTIERDTYFEPKSGIESV